jgi:hypothetical protein
MDMKQCAQGGHYYDGDVHSECPYCKNANVGVTMPLDMVNRAVPGEDNRTRAQGAADNGRTVALIKEELGIDPVVGWLVNLDGSDKGRDYRIHSDNNFIGRGEKMDICIRGDDTISRDNHAVISYDARDKVFYFAPGDGRSIVRLNGKALLTTAELKAYDTIEIGKTQLMFVPLCGEKFDWA